MGPLVKIHFLGDGFNQWVFPTVLLISVMLTACDCIGAFMNMLGLRQYSFDDDYAEKAILEGKKVIERYQ